MILIGIIIIAQDDRFTAVQVYYWMLLLENPKSK